MTDRLLHVLWTDLDGAADAVDAVTTTGPQVVLPSAFDVTGFASACVGAASLAVAELEAARTGGPIRAVSVDRTSACASFLGEALFEPVGWERPPVWDTIAGDHRTADGWIRLHTNYASHRDAAVAVLGTPADRDLVAAAVATWKADELEQAVVDAGGCAAALRHVEAWAEHPAGVASAAEVPARLGPPIPITGGLGPDLAVPSGARPLAGIRVLDLTRVIAGPVATRFLAGYGADVVRIDPPGFEEVGALVPVSTVGKRCAALDLREAADRSRFEALVAEAHVVVAGYRPGALASLGYDPDRLRSINPAIITVTHDAYGWAGPWAGRRGFDSLVQMSTGIAAAGADALGVDRPVPLPAQALDHGTGHLLAAATCRALTRLATTGAATDVSGSLVGAANVVLDAPVADGLAADRVPWPADLLEPVATAWGPARSVPLAGTIAGVDVRFPIDAGPLDRHEPRFATST